jgi:hypothetical protein
MKKTLTFLTGIAFFIAILTAASCSPPEGEDDLQVNLRKVNIYCKAVVIDKEMHLRMYDSNKPDSAVIDNLITNVQARTKVTWQWTSDSEIQKFVKIRPTHPNGNIIPGNAHGVAFTNKERLKIPKDATDGQEKYDIIFLDLDGDTVIIDPHLKIPPPT